MLDTWQKNIHKSLILFLLIFMWEGCSSGEWVWIGEPATRKKIANADYADSSFVLDSSDRPVVAWVDNGIKDDLQVFIKRWDGSKWVEIGKNSTSHNGISNSVKGTVQPSIALDKNDFPVVAWTNLMSRGSEIHIKRWNGKSWVEIGEGSASGGGISDSNKDAGLPSLSIDSKDNPVVIWSQSDGSSEEYFTVICIKRWNGNKWVEIGGSSASGKGISKPKKKSYQPSLVLDSYDMPVVAWITYRDYSSFDGDIYIKRWNGKSWVEIGKGSGSGTVSDPDHCDLALGSSGNPFIVWTNDVANKLFSQRVNIRKWNGNEWIDIGNDSQASSSIASKDGYGIGLSLVVDSHDKPVLSWIDVDIPLKPLSNWKPILFHEKVYWKMSYTDYSIYVKRWNGEKWENVGKNPLFSGFHYLHHGLIPDTSLALDSNDNPFVEWENGPEINIKRFIPGDSP